MAVGAAAVVAVVGGYFWVNRVSPSEETVADQWMEAVSRYGIEPVYPPEEDVYVGDILAIVTDDAKRDRILGPLPHRSVLLQHLNVSDALKARYSDTFRVPNSRDWPGDGKIWPSKETEGAIFSGSGVVNSLPIALLPDFTVTATKGAQLTAGGWIGFAARLGFGTDRSRTTTFKVEGIETYGVTALDGQDLLEHFCANPTTQLECQDRTVRAHLSAIFGKEIFDTVRDRDTWEVKPRYTVELELITRIYLIRRLETKIEDRSHARADVEDTTAPTGQTTSGKAIDGTVAPVSGFVETNSGVLIGGSAQTFERPIAFGFRYVSHYPKPPEPQ